MELFETTISVHFSRLCVHSLLFNHFLVLVEYSRCSGHYVLQDSGAHIKVFVQCCPHSTERVIQVAGQQDKVVVCIGMIMEDLVEVCLLLVCISMASLANVLLSLHFCCQLQFSIPV